MTAFPRFYCVLFCTGALVLCATKGRTATLVVDLTGTGDFTAIQPAIDAARAGDTVMVKAGEYEITEPISFKGKAITMRSESDAETTTIRMSETPRDRNRASVVGFESRETAASLLEGFTIRGGRGNVGCGSGVYCDASSSPTLSNCTISGNDGGVCCATSSPRLNNCTISGNDGSGFSCIGGASPTLNNCTISGNSTTYGGGVFCENSSPTLSNCTISGNSVFSFLGREGPVGGFGGGVYCSNSSPTLNNCTISGNSAGRSGGGVYCGEGSFPKLTNCIVWGNAREAILNDGSSNSIVSFSDIENAVAWPGTGNIDQDPLVVQPGHFEDSDADGTNDTWIAGDYHLQPGSPCIDTGTCGGAPPLDIEGHVRPSGAGCDMGAYEFGAPPAPLFRRGDTNGDAKADISDAITTLGFLFLGNPGQLTCEKSADANDDGRVDLSDPVALLNHLFLGASPPPQPFPNCGTDGTADGLLCDSSGLCA